MKKDMDQFIFTTYEDEDFRTYKGIIDPKYSVEYDKRTHQVTLSPTAITRLTATTVPPQKYTAEELDELAEKALSTFDQAGALYERRVDLSMEDGELSRITYSYIEKVDDVYDERSIIKLTITSSGFIEEFYIIDYDEEEINPPLIKKEEILEKINSEAEVTNVFMVRNVSGQMEYEVHLTYKDISYSAIFDGDTGELKYFGREMRKYNL